MFSLPDLLQVGPWSVFSGASILQCLTLLPLTPENAKLG